MLAGDPQTRNKMLQAMLRPLARFCLRFSISLPEILEALKRELVRSAQSELAKSESKETVSKLNAMTGVTRREIGRIIEEEEPEEMKQSLLARVINRWQQDKRFKTSSGRPKTLTYKGEESEFKDLVWSVSKDTNAPAMLFEMKRIGAVAETNRGLKLLSEESAYKEIPERALNLIYRNIDSLMHSAEQNLFHQAETKNYFLRTEFDNIPADKVPEVRKWLQDKGNSFHRDAREYLASLDRDLSLQSETDLDDRAAVVLAGFSVTDTNSDQNS